jgi:Cys-tRNA(Pro)/Cys-tRNA(Cys) deacylase
MPMTPAIRAVQAAGVAYTLHPYAHDPNADSFGLEAAEKIGVAPERVFKTLVAQIDGRRLVMAVLPVTDRLDLKRLAAAADGKKADLADPAAAERATGYVVGGISPIGGRKSLPTFIDARALQGETMFFSAGQRGLQMEMAPADFLRLTGGAATEGLGRA